MTEKIKNFRLKQQKSLLLEDKQAVVTGAGHVIGRCIVLALVTVGEIIGKY